MYFKCYRFTRYLVVLDSHFRLLICSMLAFVKLKGAQLHTHLLHQWADVKIKGE